MKTKALLTTLTAGILAIFLMAVSLPSLAQAPQPVSQWKFDEGTGASTGSGGTLQGDASWDAGVAGGYSLRLTGTPGGFVDIPQSVVDTTHSYTVTACVKLKQASGWQTFVSIDGTQVSGFFLQLRGDTGEFAFTTLSQDDPSGDTETAGSQIDPDEDAWYLLAGVYDSTTKSLSLYVNGVLQKSVPYETPWKANGHTVIGRGKYAGNPIDFADADIDNVRLYDSALSASAIQTVYQTDLPVSARPPVIPPGHAATMVINAGHPGVSVTHAQHGLMTEEINHAYDGGLYAELIQNRAFQDSTDGPSHWSVVQSPGGSGTISLDTTQPLSRALPVSLKLTGGSGVGVANDGYWGIPVHPNTIYQASFYAKAVPGFSGSLTVDIESNNGAKIYAKTTVSKVTGNWHKYTVTLKTGPFAPSEANRFVIATNRPGTIWLDLVSLFPPTYQGRPNGSRIDLMQKLTALKPAFLRFPGGNYLEGDTIADRFDWKKTLGPLTQRPGHEGPWSYRSTDGLGMLEFLEWCEDLHMQPLLAVYAGYSLNHYHNPNPERVEPGPALKPFVQDALDEIEYITGGVNTKWGARRAKDGHPQPFKLKYVEVGNEDWFDVSGSYDARFAQFYDAIKVKYPALQIIATTGVGSRKPDVIDEHYYLSPRTFERDTHHYDTYDRKGPKIFVGEWASQEGDPSPDLNSALGDMAWLTGLERNSDIVVMETYAPLLVNVNPGGRQWGTNLIGYDALHSYGSPSYYAQVMFAANRGTALLSVTIDGAPRLIQSVTRDRKTGMIYVKVVNPTSRAQLTSITLKGISKVIPDGTAVVLSSASPKDTNSLADPTRVVPKTSKVMHLGKTFRYTFAPYSFTILRIQTK